MIPLLQFVIYVLHLYSYVVIAAVIFSWLIGFNIVNPHNDFVRTLWRAVQAMTEPLMRPIRRLMPDLGGLDLSPIILLLAIYFLQSVVIQGWLIDGLLRRA